MVSELDIALGGRFLWKFKLGSKLGSNAKNGFSTTMRIQ